MKFTIILDQLYNHSKKSPCNMQHAAAIISNGKIISCGYNQPISDKNCMHAEEDAIRRYLLYYSKVWKKQKEQYYYLGS